MLKEKKINLLKNVNICTIEYKVYFQTLLKSIILKLFKAIFLYLCFFNISYV
jgi:hypothetical protein